MLFRIGKGIVELVCVCVLTCSWLESLIVCLSGRTNGHTYGQRTLDQIDQAAAKNTSREL